MLDIQKGEDFKAAPKLKEPCMAPKQYQKMNVANSFNLLSNDVHAGLILYKEVIPGDTSSTAWFCKLTFKWFKLMTSRSISLALSRSNEKEYKEATQFMQDFMWITANLKFRSNSNCLLPFQKGILISTQSCLDLHEYLIMNGFKFFLTSRTTTDCVENIFSQVRVKAKKPSGRTFAQILRMIAVSNFVTKTENSNYQFDKCDESFSMIDFLEEKLPIKTPEIVDMNVFATFHKKPMTLTKIEENHIYYFSGYILKKLKTMRSSYCVKCWDKMLLTRKTLPRLNSHNKLVLLKNFKDKPLLIFPNQAIFKYFVLMEKIVKNLKEQNFFHKTGCYEFFLKLMENEKFDPFLSCHDTKSKIISLFFRHRLRISLKQRNRNKEQNAKLIY